MSRNTIGITNRLWVISSRWQLPMSREQSEACAWLGAQWPVVMTMAGRLKSQGSPRTAAEMLAAPCTGLRGGLARSWAIDGSSPTYWPMSLACRCGLLAGGA